MDGKCRPTVIRRTSVCGGGGGIQALWMGSVGVWGGGRFGLCVGRRGDSGSVDGKCQRVGGGGIQALWMGSVNPL